MITLRLDKNGGINKGDVQAFEHDNKSEVYIIQLCKNGEIYDLTDKTIELTMVERKRKIGDMVSLPIYNATEGKVKLEVVSDITKQDGIYDFKLTVKDTTGLIETFPSFQVKIENDITDHITGEIVQDKNFTILTEGLKALADYNIYKTNALKVPEIEQDIVEINEQLDKKVNYFETVASMKTSNKIKKDSLCKTLGYYKAGDGGGAIYRITDNPALENAFSFSVAKGLTAELIYDDEINIKQLGARDFDDNGNKVDIKPFIDLYLAKTNPVGNATVNKKIIKLFIPAGRWFSSSCKLKGSSIYIHGTNAYSYPYATGTIIMPLQDNQLNLWIIGDDTTESAGLEYGNISLKNLMFSTHNASKSDSIHVAGLIADKCYTCGKLLHISRVYGGVFDNIHFTNYIGTPLTINSSNEIIFNDFTFRNGDAFESGNVVFDTDVTGNKNISACFFDKFSFEGIKGHLFVFRTDSKFINNKIGTILFEDREVKISQDGEFTNYTATEHRSMSFISKSVFAIDENSYCELIVDDVLLNNFGKVFFTKDDTNYLFDSVVIEYGKISKGQVNIKNVSHVGARRDTLLLKKADYEGLGSYNFNFTCENARHIDSESYKFLIKTPGSMKPYIRYKDSIYKRCIDYVTSPNTLLNKNGKYGYYMPVITDNDSLTDEKLVIDNFQYKKYLASFSTETSCFEIPVIGNKLRIRVKTKTGFVAHCYITKNVEYQNYTKNSTGEQYMWYTIDFTEYRQAHPNDEMTVAIRTLTSDETNYARLDVFYWE